MGSLDYRLCYVDGGWMHFTNAPLPEQSGNKWDIGSYREAGPPMLSYPMQLVRVLIESDLLLPHELDQVHRDSPLLTHALSVRSINDGARPWLSSMRGADPSVQIWGGDTLRSVIDKVRDADGALYMNPADCYDACDYASRFDQKWRRNERVVQEGNDGRAIPTPRGKRVVKQ